MGKWGKVGEAKASGDSLPNLLAGEDIGTRGDFLVRITNVKDVDGRSGDLFFIIEFEVLRTSHDSAIVGRQYSQVIKYNQEMGPTNVKRFILAANGLDPQDEENEDSCGEDEVEFVLSEDQPLVGIEIELSCEVIKTKNKGTPFTKHTWHPVESDDSEAEDPKDVA